jgi:uncharacterized protein YndB with AHSA1/START domain/mannose-6-phosphate isomerase-like protein (cupin superfamily)
MVKPGDTLEAAPLGVRLEIRRTAADTGGELVEFDVVGRARGFITQPHKHAKQAERHEVIEGAMRLVIDGREHLLGPGDAIEVPRGATHRQVPAGAGAGRVRVQLRPAANSEAFLERLADIAHAGQYNRWGYPKPRAAARLLADFRDEGRPALPALRSREYMFVDEWEVAAPREAVFDALADARTYPRWWRPVYIDVEADGEPALGKVSRQHFKGRLPYHLHTRSTIIELDRPHLISGDVDGDLRGRGTWTLTETARGTRVRFDWRVHADRRLLRVLTPVLRPAFRWNHDWAIARAIEGLEPFVLSPPGR